MNENFMHCSSCDPSFGCWMTGARCHHPEAIVHLPPPTTPYPGDPAPTRSALNQAAGETPRTDAFFNSADCGSPFGCEQFARTLEREVREANRVIAEEAGLVLKLDTQLRSAHSRLAKLSAERDSKELEVKGALAQLSQHVSWLKVSEAECKALQQKVEVESSKVASMIASRRTLQEQFDIVCRARDIALQERDGMRDAASDAHVKLMETEERLATATRQNEEMAKEVADHERWFKEMVADYRLQADDHKASWRYAINCLIHKHRDGESAALAMVETMRGRIAELEGAK